MTRFTADQLTTFATVVDYGTFEAAADVLMISASAVSQRIKAMEQSAGRVLIKRTNPVEPTEPGTLVLRVARQSQYLHDELARELDGDRSGQTVAIAINSDSLSTWLLDAVRVLAREDHIYCDLRREGEYHSSALLRSGEVMAAVTSEPEAIAGCSVEKLGIGSYWPVASAEFAQDFFPDLPRNLTAEQLASAPVIEYDHKDFGQQRGRQLIAAKFKLGKNLQDAPSVYVPSSPDYVRAVDTGIGWGIVPYVQCADALAAGRWVKLADAPVEIPLYWQHWKITSSVMERVTQRIYEALGEGHIY
ncbi:MULTISPECIES: ArgP/LysG family DNA-binding transcriptional regulator [unclassified Rothia (in: high G+C Gram-positive bacteria)]|uniref:ArgP/LysG family DNA-binding transcriptional regulator n=1 Tax=unclassified Rothia (in: high G+C Gram-positive bacteria) TaxID=2689056 RepID=UPI001957FA7B|nr:MULTISPECIES: ArgP/LysG family DNA-binding transcriptional regulator [unclassified Rothia (in: high G+C Gram-positive bacteria)]MBM7052264.1 ArgP/LysG family DNA-binding transcriptional regulator [Rothia sp. ZJ1223]QRZ61535.1 ArgP/LysG family DNA-binding transcriptional regulator [Rothia sp. ZJ932]